MIRLSGESVKVAETLLSRSLSQRIVGGGDFGSSFSFFSLGRISTSIRVSDSSTVPKLIWLKEESKEARSTAKRLIRPVRTILSPGAW